MHVPALVVVPEYRRKGLSTRLLDMLQRRLGNIVDEGLYEFTESATFTAKVAADFGHEITQIAVRFERKKLHAAIAHFMFGWLLQSASNPAILGSKRGLI